MTNEYLLQKDMTRRDRPKYNGLERVVRNNTDQFKIIMSMPEVKEHARDCDNFMIRSMQINGREININSFDDGQLAREIEQQSKQLDVSLETDEQQSNSSVNNISKGPDAAQETVGAGYIPKGLVVTCSCGQNLKPTISSQQGYTGPNFSKNGSNDAGKDNTYGAGMTLKTGKTY